jgi:hypothetical protein
MKSPKFEAGQQVEILSANEADEFYIGKIGVVDEFPNYDCRTWYYSVLFKEYAKPRCFNDSEILMAEDCDDMPPYFTEDELRCYNE